MNIGLVIYALEWARNNPDDVKAKIESYMWQKAEIQSGQLLISFAKSYYVIRHIHELPNFNNLISYTNPCCAGTWLLSLNANDYDLDTTHSDNRFQKTVSLKEVKHQPFTTVAFSFMATVEKFIRYFIADNIKTIMLMIR